MSSKYGVTRVSCDESFVTKVPSVESSGNWATLIVSYFHFQTSEIVDLAPLLYFSN